MAAGVKAAAFGAFIRVYFTAFPGLYSTWDAIAIWLAVITMASANLIALVQGNVPQSEKFDPRLMLDGVATYMKLAALPPKEADGAPDAP